MVLLSLQYNWRSETVFDLHNDIYKYFDSISEEAVSRKAEE